MRRKESESTRRRTECMVKERWEAKEWKKNTREKVKKTTQKEHIIRNLAVGSAEYHDTVKN